MTLIYLLLCATSTSAASAAHGGDHFPKAAVIALHVIVSPLVAPIYWLFFRRGKHAQAELALLNGQGSLGNVKATYPKPFGWLVAKAIAKCKTRREQELRSGFVIGLTLGIVTAPAVLFI